MFARLLTLAILGLAAAGCGASIDENGVVITDRVWFDQGGAAHCPHPDCTPPTQEKGADGVKKFIPKLNPTADELKQSIVHPWKNVCEAGHPVTWASEDVVCWSCQGAKTCRYCRGTGASTSGKSIDCSGCISTKEEGGKTSTGICGECMGKGTVRYGGSWNEEKARVHNF